MKRHVVIELNKGRGSTFEVIQIRPRDGERLADWNVYEQAGVTMVQVAVTFQGSDGKQRVVSEVHNSFRLDRVYVEGDDE